MKNVLPALAALLAPLSACTDNTSDDTDRCLDRNLDDITDIVDAADNPECHFRYDTEGFDVTCPSSEIHTVRVDTYDVLFYDENNDFDFDMERIFLTCGHHDYEIDDRSELELIQEELRMSFSRLPIPD